MEGYIVKQLIVKNIISNKDGEIYLFGIRQMIMLLLNTGTTLIISVLYDMVWQGILFSVSYIWLRSFAGGYHADTKIKCYIYSVILTLAVFPVIRASGNLETIILELALSFVVIIFLAPDAHVNKPLDDKERRRYRRKCINILLFEMSISICLTLTISSEAGACIAIACLATAAMLLVSWGHKMRHR